MGDQGTSRELLSFVLAGLQLQCTGSGAGAAGVAVWRLSYAPAGALLWQSGWAHWRVLMLGQPFKNSLLQIAEHVTPYMMGTKRAVA
jgi:hypothetical protein